MSDKPPTIEKALDVMAASFGGSRAPGRCATCPRTFDPATEFKDALSRTEYGISNMCQACQDGVFNAAEDPEERRDLIQAPKYWPYWLDEAWIAANPSHHLYDGSEPRSNPRFLKRTDRKYARLSLADFTERAGMSIMLKSLTEYLPEGAVIAGGFMQQVVQDCLLTTEPILVEQEVYWEQHAAETIASKPKTHRDQKDVDIFFTSEKAFRDTLELLQEPPGDDDAWMWQGYEIKADLTSPLQEGGDSLRHVTFESNQNKPALQLIKLAWYQDAEHIIDTFDFTCVQFATDGKDLIMNPLSVFDLARKRLVLHRMQFPASTLRRLLKYSQKGFYACPGALAKIADEMHKAYVDGVKDSEEFVYLD